MKAALVTSFDAVPEFTEIADVAASGPDEVVINVLAAGLHPRVRSQATGTHYTSGETLPIVPGVDGVGRLDDGTLVYFVAEGSMAQRIAVDRRRIVELAADADPVRLAAAMNPAMSSWVALRRRIDFRAGQRVLVLGATGSAGRLAVQVARRLGASWVVAAGRNGQRLGELTGADEKVLLDGTPAAAAALGAAAADVDVVIDYVWGTATRDALHAIVPRRADDQQQLTWIQVGSVGGPEAGIPSAALRATRLQLVGSGQGSVATADIVAELGELAGALADDTLTVDARPVPLADVASVWNESTATRVVLVP